MGPIIYVVGGLVCCVLAGGFFIAFVALFCKLILIPILELIASL